MLANATVTTMLPVIDMARAREFYERRLGLIPAGFQPDILVSLLKPFRDGLPWLLTDDGDIQLGPIPKGTPVGLISNLNLRPDKMDLVDRVKHDFKLAQFVTQAKRDLHDLPPDASDEQARKTFANLVPAMLELSKCPDLVVNRGHYFGTDRFAEEPGLSDPEKRDLIEFLKTF